MISVDTVHLADPQRLFPVLLDVSPPDGPFEGAPSAFATGFLGGVCA